MMSGTSPPVLLLLHLPPEWQKTMSRQQRLSRPPNTNVASFHVKERPPKRFNAAPTSRLPTKCAVTGTLFGSSFSWPFTVRPTTAVDVVGPAESARSPNCGFQKTLRARLTCQ